MSEEIHFLEDGYCVDKLEKDIQKLKEKCNQLQTMIKTYKEVIGEVRERVEQVAAYPYANFDIETKEGFCQVSISKWFDDLLQILDKVGDNNV